jgi:quercetin dioxygenase-like cupin family protein
MTINTTFKADTGLLWFLNNLVSIPVSFRDSPDQLSVIELWAPYGDSPPQHIHHSQDEVFVVLKGRLRVNLGGRDIILNAGDRALAPKGIAHSFVVESAEGAQFLTLTTGPDFETLVRKVARSADHPGLPQAAAPSPEAIAGLAALCAESRIEMVGPPLV